MLKVLRSMLFATELCLSEVPNAVSRSSRTKVVKPATIVWYRDAMRTLIESIGRDISVNSITVEELRIWQKYQEDNYEVRTANARKRSVSSQFNKLAVLGVLDGYRDNGRLVAYLVDSIQLKPEPRNTCRAMTPATYRAMYAKADLKWRTIMCVLWHTGIRRAELTSITMDKVEFWENEEGELCCKFYVCGKADYQRWVACRGKPAVMLKDWKTNVRPYNLSSWLFPGHGRERAMGTSTLNGAFRKLWALAEIPPSAARTPHCMRHAFALRRLELGDPVNVAAAMMGINPTTFLENYVTPHDATVLAAMLA